MIGDNPGAGVSARASLQFQPCEIPHASARDGQRADAVLVLRERAEPGKESGINMKVGEVVIKTLARWNVYPALRNNHGTTREARRRCPVNDHFGKLGNRAGVESAIVFVRGHVIRSNRKPVIRSASRWR